MSDNYGSASYDLDALRQIDASTDAGRLRANRELLNAMFVLVKNGLLFDPNNPVLHHACDRVAAVCNLICGANDGTASISFLADGVYVNRILLRLDSAGFERGEYLLTIWRAFGVGELVALNETGRDDWLEVIGELRQCIRSGAGSDALRDRQFANVRLAPIEEVTHRRGAQQGARYRALRAYTMAVMVMEDVVARARDGRRVRLVDLKRPMQELIGVIPQCTELVLALTQLKRNKQTLASSLVNTAVLAICMARRFDLGRSQQTELALQACLHQLTEDPDPSEDPHEAHRASARLSISRVVSLTPGASADMGRVVVANETRLWANSDPELDHYPYGPCGAARLIAVAHAFDRLTTPTSARPALLPDEAVRVIMAEAGRRYDDTAVRLLVDLVGVHPVGSVLLLSSGELAVAVKASSAATRWSQPFIKIIRDPAGKPTDGPALDLADDAAAAGRQVVGCVDAEHAGINTPAFLIG